MRYTEAFSNPRLGRRLLEAIGREAAQPRDYFLMEFCGGHTHALHRHGLPALLPPNVHLLHGPGCPVCVLPMGRLNQALALLAQRPVVLCSFGDMSRVPGSRGQSLLGARAQGADVRTVLGPSQALQLAEALPQREVVFFAVGFETTAPPTALVLREARRKGLHNFSVLCNHVRTPPAIHGVLQAFRAGPREAAAQGPVVQAGPSSGPEQPCLAVRTAAFPPGGLGGQNTAPPGGPSAASKLKHRAQGSPTKRSCQSEAGLDGMIAPGHVATVTGIAPFEAVSKAFGLPVCVSGFEVLDLLEAIWRLLCQLNRGEARVENAYARAAPHEGNPVARRLMGEVFEVLPSFEWRGLGALPESAYGIAKGYAAWDAEAKWQLPSVPVADHPSCCCASVLQGRKKPTECTLFGRRCTPDAPLGACMVSPEGACSAYYTYVFSRGCP